MDSLNKKNAIEIGRKYPIHIFGRDVASDLKNTILQYSFKPASVETAETLNLDVSRNSDSAVLKVPSHEDNGHKIFRGTIMKPKESILAFKEGQFYLEPVSLVVQNLKHARDEQYVGEELGRVTVAAYLKALNKKRKLSSKAGSSKAGEATKKTSLSPEPALQIDSIEKVKSAEDR